MPGPSPARLLAPVALALTALALLIVLASGGGDAVPATDGTAEPTATATATAARTPRPTREPTADPGDATSYTVRPGDTPSTIAQQQGVSVDALLEANPDVDPNALSVGDELEIPAG